MKILSLDTAMAACSVAVVDTAGHAPLAAAYMPMERGHAEVLPQMVAEVMAASGLHVSEIDRIAVTTGPGTFTGLRIGLAFARGLGLARNIPVIGIDSLTAIAANEAAPQPLLVTSDARNGEVYAASFDPDRKTISAPHLCPIADAADNLPPGTLVLGTAAAAVIRASGRQDLIASAAGVLPVAAHFARLAEAARPGGMPTPLYLRAPDAKPQTGPLRKIGRLTTVVADASAAALLAELHGEIFDEGWSAASLAALLGTPGTEALMALEDDQPLGFIIIRRAADEAEIITIGTRPSLQRRGVARELLDQQMARLVGMGIKSLFLEVAASNMPAQSLYASLGFTEVGRRTGYYRRPDGTMDAIVMRRELVR